VPISQILGVLVWVATAAPAYELVVTDVDANTFTVAAHGDPSGNPIEAQLRVLGTVAETAAHRGFRFYRVDQGNGAFGPGAIEPDWCWARLAPGRTLIVTVSKAASADSFDVRETPFLVIPERPRKRGPADDERCAR